MEDGHVDTIPTLILETLVVAFEYQHETKEMEGGGEKKRTRGRGQVGTLPRETRVKRI